MYPCNHLLIPCIDNLTRVIFSLMVIIIILYHLKCQLDSSDKRALCNTSSQNAHISSPGSIDSIIKYLRAEIVGNILKRWTHGLKVPPHKSELRSSITARKLGFVLLEVILQRAFYKHNLQYLTFQKNFWRRVRIKIISDLISHNSANISKYVWLSNENYMAVRSYLVRHPL